MPTGSFVPGEVPAPLRPALGLVNRSPSHVALVLFRLLPLRSISAGPSVELSP